MTINELNNEINKLEKKIVKQREVNVRLYNSIPAPSYKDPQGKKAEPILKQWREGSRKIKELIDKQNKLRDARRELTPPPAVEQQKTFVNGFGEATTREITSSTYERAQKRLDKKILSFMGRR
ncbi:MAG: hypothetical protein ACRC3H_16830 [Lachnospiraceae bacterium]